MLAFSSTRKERFSNVLKMKTREQNKHNKRMEIERFDWFIEQIQMRLAFGWLHKPSGEKKLQARELSRNQSLLRFDIILQHDWPNEQCLLHIRVFFGGKRRRPCFDLFIHWLIKQITNTYRNHFSRSYKNHSKCSPTNSLAVTSSIPLSTAEANSIPIFISRNT